MSIELIAVLMFSVPCIVGIMGVLLDNLLERWGVR